MPSAHTLGILRFIAFTNLTPRPPRSLGEQVLQACRVANHYVVHLAEAVRCVNLLAALP
jgi:hypothetical protein